MKLTAANYYSAEANAEFFSVSQFKSFCKCPACTMAELRGGYKRPKSTALLVGSFVDSYFEGTLEAFKEDNPEIFTKNGTLKADYQGAERIIERIERDRLFREHMSGEKQVIMTGVIAGVPFKIKMDSYREGVAIDDLKVVKDFENIYIPGKGAIPWFEAWGYTTQGAVYQEIVRQNTGERLPFFLAAASKETEPNIDIVHIGQDFLDRAIELVEYEVLEYDAVKSGIIEARRCEKCDFCKSTKVLSKPTEAEEFYF